MPSLQVQLEQAREHVSRAQERVELQVDLIERLRSDHHDTAAAESLLAMFLDVMTKLTLHRDRLEHEAEERSRSHTDEARLGGPMGSEGEGER